MSLWHFAVGNKKFGPMGQDDAIRFAITNPEALAWSPGMTDWVKVKRIREFSQVGQKTPFLNQDDNICDEIDYQIVGNDIQFVEIELDTHETAIAEAGAMMYKDDTVEMRTLLGDGSRSGVVNKLISIGRRVITGEGMFITAFTHKGVGKGKVAFAAPYPGHIIPISLPSVGGKIICQKDAFLCAARGVSINVYFQKKVMTALFGGQGFVMQKLEGDGMVFVHAGGAIHDITLEIGEGLHIDTGCLVALEESVDFSVETVGGIKSQLFGGEGVFVTHLKGPGRVWLQSMPFSRFAGRMWTSLSPFVSRKRMGIF
ncbi:MAG: TIGR00266 family protein [Alphaproteobacteria bacterium]